MNKEVFELISKYTRINRDRLQLIVNVVEPMKMPGCIVECGVFMGGTLAAFAYGHKRTVWGFDSWEGCRNPRGIDWQIQDRYQASDGMCAEVDYENTKNFIYNEMKFEKDRVKLVKGWVEDTLPKYKEQIGPIALLHVDLDLYDPIKFTLDTLYDQVVAGGLVCCDDYNYWAGANIAVHEFVADKPVTLERPTTNGVWWRKRCGV